MPFGAKSLLRGWDNRDLGASFVSFMIHGSSCSLASAHRGRKNYKGPPSHEDGPERRRNRALGVYPPHVRRDTEDCAPHDRPESARGRALLRKAGLLARSFFRPPSRNVRCPSGYGRCCRAYSGGSAPVLHRTSRTPSEALLSARSLYGKRRECQMGFTPPPHSEPRTPPGGPPLEPRPRL